MSVIVVCPNKIRVTVKTTPITTLQQVLTEACKKQGFQAELYGLSHHNRPMDLSLNLRFSSLPNNAVLETFQLQNAAISAPKTVQIGVHFETGERIVERLAGDATLEGVLAAMEGKCGKSLLIPDSQQPLLQPVCQYLTQKFVGRSILAATTLEMMGVRNSALLRYSTQLMSQDELLQSEEVLTKSRAKQAKLDEVFLQKQRENEERERLEEARRLEWEKQRLAEEAKAQEMETEQLPTAGVESAVCMEAVLGGVGRGAGRLGRLESLLNQVDRSIQDDSPLPFLPQPDPSLIIFADFKFPEETRGVDLRSEASSQAAVEPAPRPLTDRRPLVFGVPFSDGSSQPLDDSFFDITAKDVQLMQKSRQEEVSSLSERAFLPAALVKAKDRQRKIEAWKTTVIRFLLPDHLVLQAVFNSTEKLQAVYDFVEKCLDPVLGVKKTDLELSVPPNQKLDDINLSLIDANLAPKATLVLTLKNTSVGAVKLKSELLKKIVDRGQADVIAQDCVSVNTVYTPYRGTVQEVETSVLNRVEAAAGRPNRVQTPAQNVPKWFKGGKK